MCVSSQVPRKSGAKLKRVQRYLGVDTETEVIDRMLDAYDFERGLNKLLASGQDAFRDYRSPLVRGQRR